MHSGSNFINGVWSKEKETFKTINPSTEEILTEFPNSNKGHVEEAVRSARKAFKFWKNESRVKRSDYFFTLANLILRDQKEIAEIISLETGKSLNESNAEVIEAVHMCQVAFGSGRTSCGDVISSEITHKDCYVMRKPKGVVAVITPFNFPFAISLWTSAPAIVEGNCVVQKPSEFTPWVAEKLARLIQEARIPEGVYNLVCGAGDLGSSLSEHPDVNCILFTGSYGVGQKIRQTCASTFNKSCACETGSKSAVIVFNDANYNLALDVSIASAFKLTGQRCVSSGRILIQRDIYDKFCNDFAERASKITMGSPFDDPAPYCGPIISKKQMERVERYNRMVTEGVMLKGERIDRKGFFLTPHVYKSEWGNKIYLKEEVFGPNVSLVPFTDIQDSIRIYNDTDYGLAVGVVTEDFKKMRVMRQECNFGMLYHNSGSVAAESSMPFGGVRMSGNGYKSAAGTWKAVTDEIAVTVNHEEGITWAQGMK